VEETVRQLPDGEELVFVYDDTSPFRPRPAEDDPRTSSIHLRQAAVATKGSDLPARYSWPPSSATGEAGATGRRPAVLAPSPSSTQGRDRAGSLADGGGVSAAAVEARSAELLADGARPGPGRSHASWRGASLLAAAGAFAILAGWRIVRRRGHA